MSQPPLLLLLGLDSEVRTMSKPVFDPEFLKLGKVSKPNVHTQASTLRVTPNPDVQAQNRLPIHPG
jgi:hypothetical protein